MSVYARRRPGGVHRHEAPPELRQPSLGGVQGWATRRAEPKRARQRALRMDRNQGTTPILSRNTSSGCCRRDTRSHFASTKYVSWSTSKEPSISSREARRPRARGRDPRPGRISGTSRSDDAPKCRIPTGCLWERSTVFTDAWGSYTALGRLGIDHRPRKGGHGRHALDGLPWAHNRLRQPEDVVARNLPRCQPQASPALPRRVHLPPRLTPARGRALRIRPTPRRARQPAPLPTACGGANGIAREFPIPYSKSRTSPRSRRRGSDCLESVSLRAEPRSPRVAIRSSRPRRRSCAAVRRS
jgi:hypothetical protein